MLFGLEYKVALGHQEKLIDRGRGTPRDGKATWRAYTSQQIKEQEKLLLKIIKDNKEREMQLYKDLKEMKYK